MWKTRSVRGKTAPTVFYEKKIFFTQVEKTFKPTSSIHNTRNPWESFSHMSRKLPNSTPPYTVPVTHENRRFILGDKRSRSDLTVLWTCGQARQVFWCENQSSSPGRQASPTPAQPLSAFFLCVENDASINLYPYHRWVELSGRLGNVWVKGLVWFPLKFIVHTSREKNLACIKC